MSKYELKFDLNGAPYALTVAEKNGYSGSYSTNALRAFAETMAQRIVRYGDTPRQAEDAAKAERGMFYLDATVGEVFPQVAQSPPLRLSPDPPPSRTRDASARKARAKADARKRIKSATPASSINNRFRNTPTEFRLALSDVQNDSAMNDVLKLFETRRPEFRSDQAMFLAAAYLNPLARKHVDDALDQFWRKQAMDFKFDKDDRRDVVIGGGLHAAIYSVIAHAKTGIKPIVLDDGPRVGGAFAVTQNPSFYLNSRNRPGPLALPGMEMQGSLNYIPGAPVQPADLSADEYADNATLGWAVRMTLAMNAEVISGAKVTDITDEGVYTTLERIPAARVIVATGLGVPARFRVQKSARVMNFWDFMRRMDTPFPMRGMGRVAVLGAGDGGKTVIEALIGQGPARATVGVAALDWVKEIDWYGVPYERCIDWEANNRSRYKGIGRSLPRAIPGDASVGGRIDVRTARILPVPAQPSDVTVGFNEVMVDGKPYDNVVIATGFDLKQRITPLDETVLTNSSIEQVGGMQVGRRIVNGGVPTYLIGPAARLELTNVEQAAVGPALNIPENTTSIFRYARKTATLADSIN